MSLLCIGLALLLAPGGCGKGGMPQPVDTSRNFSWKEVDAAPAGGCLAFTGSFEGAYENFAGLRVEIAALAGPEDCPGCPFVPDKVVEISAAMAGFDPQKGSIGFSYCPRKSPAYRWRLAGINKYSRLPHADMTDRLLVVEP